MLLRGFRFFGVALHREPKGTKRLHILQMRGAPTWVCNYAKYVLFGRLIRHKVQGRLLPPRAVHVGVDMGRSFSVFLFCLAMDPIYHYCI